MLGLILALTLQDVDRLVRELGDDDSRVREAEQRPRTLRLVTPAFSKPVEERFELTSPMIP